MELTSAIASRQLWGGAGAEISVFTTRPDTLFGATYVVLSPEHPLVESVTTPEHLQKVKDYALKVASP